MSVYIKTPGRECRSFDRIKNAGTGDPWKLLASAIVYQAAVDCSGWYAEIEKPCYNGMKINGLRYRRRGKLVEFINSDWLDQLLCWQNDITPDAVAEELYRRLTHARV